MEQKTKEMYSVELFHWTRLLLAVCLNNCCLERMAEDYYLLLEDFRSYKREVDYSRHCYAITGILEFYRTFVNFIDKYLLGNFYPFISSKVYISRTAYCLAKQFDRKISFMDLTALNSDQFLYIKNTFNSSLPYITSLLMAHDAWFSVYTGCVDFIESPNFKTSQSQIEMKQYILRLDYISLMTWSGYCRYLLNTYKSRHIPLKSFSFLHQLFYRRLDQREYFTEVIIDVVTAFRLLYTFRGNSNDSAARIEIQLLSYNLKRYIDIAIIFLRAISFSDYQTTENVSDILKCVVSLNEDFSLCQLYQEPNLLRQRLSPILSSFLTNIEQVMEFPDYFNSKLLRFYKILIFMNHILRSADYSELETVIFELRLSMLRAINMNQNYFYFAQDLVHFSTKGNILLSRYINDLTDASRDVLLILRSLVVGNRNNMIDVIQKIDVLIERINKVMVVCIPAHSETITTMCEKAVDGMKYVEDIINQDSPLEITRLNATAKKIKNISDLIKAAILEEIEIRRKIPCIESQQLIFGWKFSLYQQATIKFVPLLRQLYWDIIHGDKITTFNELKRQIVDIFCYTGMDQRTYGIKTIRNYILDKDIVDDARLKKIYALRGVYDILNKNVNSDAIEEIKKKVKEVNSIDVRFDTILPEFWGVNIQKSLKEYISFSIQLNIPSIQVFAEECMKFYRSCDMLFQTIELYKEFPTTINTVKETLCNFWKKLQLLLQLEGSFDCVNPAIGNLLKIQQKQLEDDVNIIFKLLDESDSFDLIIVGSDKIYMDLVEAAGISFLLNGQISDIVQYLRKTVENIVEGGHIDTSISIFLLHSIEKIILYENNPFSIVQDVMEKGIDGLDVFFIQRAITQLSIFRSIYSTHNTSVVKSLINIIDIIQTIVDVNSIDELLMITDQITLSQKDALRSFSDMHTSGFISENDIFPIIDAQQLNFRKFLAELKSIKHTNWKMVALKQFKEIQKAIHTELYSEFLKKLCSHISIIRAFSTFELPPGKQASMYWHFESSMIIVEMLERFLHFLGIPSCDQLFTDMKCAIKEFSQDYAHLKTALNATFAVFTFLEKKDAKETYAIASEMYSKKSIILKEFGSIESFLEIAEAQIKKVVIEENLTASNRQNFMTAIDQCLGNVSNEEMMNVFDKHRERLTHYGKLSRKTAPYYIQWIVWYLQYNSTLKKLAYVRQNLLEITHIHTVRLQAEGLISDNDYNEIRIEIDKCLLIQKFMVYSVKSASLSLDSITNTIFIPETISKSISVVTPFNINGKVQWLIDAFSCWRMLQFSPSPTYASYFMYDYLSYHLSIGTDLSEQTHLLLTEYDYVVDLCNDTRQELLLPISNIHEIISRIAEYIKNHEHAIFDWIDLLHALTKLERGNGFLEKRLSDLLGECLVFAYYQNAKPFIMELAHKIDVLSTQALHSVDIKELDQTVLSDVVRSILQISDRRVLICRCGVLLLQREQDNYDDFCNICSIFISNKYTGANDSAINYFSRESIKALTQSIQSGSIVEKIGHAETLLRLLIGPTFHMIMSYVQLRGVLNKISIFTYMSEQTKEYWIIIQQAERFIQRFIGWTNILGVLDGIKYELLYTKVIDTIRQQLTKRELRTLQLKELDEIFKKTLHSSYLRIVFTLDDLLSLTSRDDLLKGMNKLLPYIAESNECASFLNSYGFIGCVNPITIFDKCYSYLQSLNPLKPTLDSTSTKIVRKYLRKITEAISIIFRIFDVQTSVVDYLVDTTIQFLDKEDLESARNSFNKLKRYMLLFPRMYLIVNSFYANFGDATTTHSHLAHLHKYLESIKFSTSKTLNPIKLVITRERSSSEPSSPQTYRKQHKVNPATSNKDDTPTTISFTTIIKKLNSYKMSFKAFCNCHLSVIGYFISFVVSVITKLQTISTSITSSTFFESISCIKNLLLPILWSTPNMRLCTVKFFGTIGMQLRSLVSQLRESIKLIVNNLFDNSYEKSLEMVKSMIIAATQQIIIGIGADFDIVGYLHRKVITAKKSLSGDSKISLHPIAIKIILCCVGDNISRVVHDILTENTHKVLLPVRYVKDLQAILITANGANIHQVTTQISSSLMMDAVPLKAIFNKVTILLALLVQCEPSEETLAVVHKYYHSAFKRIRGGVIIDSRRAEKIREIVHIIYTHVSNNSKIGDNIRTEVIGVFSLSIYTFFSVKGFKDIIEYNVALSILIDKIQFVLEVLGCDNFSQINQNEVVSILQMVERITLRLKNNPFDSNNFQNMTRSLIDLFCPFFENFVKGDITFEDNVKELLELLQSIAICTDKYNSFKLLTTFHMKLLLNTSLVLSEFNLTHCDIFNLTEERLSTSIATSVILTEFLQSMVCYQNSRTNHSYKVFFTINKNIENNMMFHTFIKLKTACKMTVCPTTFKPIYLQTINKNYRYCTLFQTIITSLSKGVTSELFNTTIDIVNKLPFLTIGFEKVAEMVGDTIKMGKCIRSVEVMSSFNRMLCWVLMIVYGFSKEDDLPLIELEFGSLLDLTEGVFF
ncbi:Non-specific serine/threonine protein kinase [Entamoeba marina]